MPTMKTIREKIRSMLVELREANRRNIDSSWIEEVVGPLLDEFISDVDDW